MASITCILVPVIRSEMAQLIDLIEHMLTPRIDKTDIYISIDSEWRTEELILLKAAHSSNCRINRSTSINFISCEIPAKESVYLRKPQDNFDLANLPYGAKSGPNIQFFKSIKFLINKGYKDSIMLLETDAIPLHDFWLKDIEEEISRIGAFYIAGAKYTGKAKLPTSIINHINGNAVYNLGARGFLDFLSMWEATLLHCIQKDPSLAYDVVLDWARFHKGALSIPDLKKLDNLCNTHLRHIRKIINISAPVDVDFDLNDYYEKTNNASVLHAKPALKHRRLLIANRSLDPLKFNKVKNIYSYDDCWQFPAITEQHAFRCALEFLPEVEGVKYFAFPWATLIDLSIHKKNSIETSKLMAALYYLKRKIGSARRLVTVCQHISAIDFQWMFNDVGITDLFWSHATKHLDKLPCFNQISVHPFPLYPVQCIETLQSTATEAPREVLFSFVGAKAKHVNPEGKSAYLSYSRNWIIENLSSNPQGFILSRDKWHYEAVVYNKQIGVEFIGSEQTQNSAEEFIRMLKKSIFSLCPSGTGPNSIRLWESIGFGAIPVILADTYLPPGDPALWEEAAVFCEETEDAIKALPAKLEHLAKDKSLLARKRKAMKQLWMLYGPDNFVHDIHKLYLQLAKPCESAESEEITGVDDSLLVLANNISRDCTPDTLRVFMLACSVRAKVNPERFRATCQASSSVQELLSQAITADGPKIPEIVRRVLNF